MKTTRLSAKAAPPPPAEAETLAEPHVTAAGMSELYGINSSQTLQKSRASANRSFATMLIEHHPMATAATMKAADKDGPTLNIVAPALLPSATSTSLASVSIDYSLSARDDDKHAGFVDLMARLDRIYAVMPDSEAAPTVTHNRATSCCAALSHPGEPPPTRNGARLPLRSGQGGAHD